MLRIIGDRDRWLSLSDRVHARVRELPMYEGGRLVTLTCEAWGRMCLLYLLIKRRLLRLDGKASTIIACNTHHGIQLNDENVMLYLWFYCLATGHGPRGTVHLLHDLTDELLPAGYDRIVGASSRAPRFAGREEDGSWRISALVHYDTAVIHADFVVRATGAVEIVNEQPLLNGVPNIDAPFLRIG